MAIPMSMLVSTLSNATVTAGPRDRATRRGEREIEQLLARLSRLANDPKSAVFRLMQPHPSVLAVKSAPSATAITNSAKSFAPSAPTASTAALQVTRPYELWQLTASGTVVRMSPKGASAPTADDERRVCKIIVRAAQEHQRLQPQGWSQFAVNLVSQEVVKLDGTNTPHWPFQLTVAVTDRLIVAQLRAAGVTDINIVSARDAAAALVSSRGSVAAE